jgi:L-lysine exporter family protein LysE/ArgO
VTSLLAAATQGFLLGASLIIAIGAQNAYLLRQGLLKRHVLPLVLVCTGADLVLILLGVAGVGRIVQNSPAALGIVTWGGAAFLAWYGFEALRRALRPGVLIAAETDTDTLRAALAKIAAFTFLNPHVYLDTVVLVGALSGRYGVPDNWAFGLGAALASAAWFTALGYGAALLAPLFARPSAWRILDLTICAVMWSIALGLAVSALRP